MTPTRAIIGAGEIDIPVDLQYMIGVAIGVPDEVPEQKPRDPSHYKTIR